MSGSRKSSDQPNPPVLALAVDGFQCAMVSSKGRTGTEQRPYFSECRVRSARSCKADASLSN